MIDGKRGSLSTAENTNLEWNKIFKPTLFQLYKFPQGIHVCGSAEILHKTHAIEKVSENTLEFPFIIYADTMNFEPEVSGPHCSTSLLKRFNSGLCKS